MKLTKMIIAGSSPVLGFIVLVLALSWLFSNISDMHQQSVLHIKLNEEMPKPDKKGPPLPETKPAQKEPPHIPKKEKHSAPKTDSAGIDRSVHHRDMAGDKMPAISIYYKQSDTKQYLAALAKRGNMILVKSPQVRLFARYEPLSGKIRNDIPADFQGYSPRTRNLAVYGENPVIDKIIETAVEMDNVIVFPEDCRLIAILTLAWEQALINAVTSAAEGKGIPFERVESAEADFVDWQFRIKRISIEGGGVVKVNMQVKS